MIIFTKRLCVRKKNFLGDVDKRQILLFQGAEIPVGRLVNSLFTDSPLMMTSDNWSWGSSEVVNGILQLMCSKPFTPPI